jgi:hypothetical protein
MSSFYLYLDPPSGLFAQAIQQFMHATCLTHLLNKYYGSTKKYDDNFIKKKLCLTVSQQNKMSSISLDQ